MYHSVFRKRLDYPANEPKKVNLPLGVRRIRVTLEGRAVGSVRFSFNRDEILRGGGFSATARRPYNSGEIWLPGAPIYLAANRDSSGVMVRVDTWSTLDSTLGQFSHKYVLNRSCKEPFSWSDGTEWNYPEHPRAWMNEQSLLWENPSQPAMGLVGNDTTNYANANTNTPVLVIPEFVPENGTLIPDTSDIQIDGIRYRLLVSKEQVPDDPVQNPIRLSVLCAVDDSDDPWADDDFTSSSSLNYCAFNYNPNPIWPLGRPTWFTYFWTDNDITKVWGYYTSISRINSYAGIALACELVEKEGTEPYETTGVAYAVVWDAEFVVYYHYK